MYKLYCVLESRDKIVYLFLHLEVKSIGTYDYVLFWCITYSLQMYFWVFIFVFICFKVLLYWARIFLPYNYIINIKYLNVKNNSSFYQS